MTIGRICITGAGSMIGRALTEYALSQGVEVLALTRPGGRRAPTHPLCAAAECDLADLASFSSDLACDALVHLGWRGTYGAERNDASMQAENIRHTLEAAALAERLGCGCFLFAGSQAEYGLCDAPLRPDTPPCPQTEYGRAKLEAGRLSADFCRRHGMRHVHARILSVYGAEDRPQTLIRTCIDCMRRGQAPELTDCTQIWDYLYIDDAARALFALLARGKDGAIYPVGSGESRPLRDFVETIRELTGCKAQPLYGARPAAQGSVTHLQADISALTADTGFTPKVSFREGIARIIRRQQNEEIIYLHKEVQTMRTFMDKDFLLFTDTAKRLYAAAEQMPIFDWHCHLSPREIYENRQPDNIAQLWLAGDHYKWRAMRSYGVDEKYVTGDATDYEKFCAFAEVMPALIGNPMYHWTHLELQRYFDITETLSPATADAIWTAANAKIAAGGFTPRELIERSGVVCVCTTDDPADLLEYHKLIAADASFGCKVLPAFRPDAALNIDLPGFLPWLARLESAIGSEIRSFAALKDALRSRVEFFDAMGCRASDQAFSYVPYDAADDETVEAVFRKALAGDALTAQDCDRYRTALMRFLAAEYDRKGWAMELHIGPMRNNNTKMFRAIGPDAGFDSIGDAPVAQGLSRFLDSMALEDHLPKTILFTLNPRDNYVLGTMLGNFQQGGVSGKIQFGSGWWFNDHIDGMREQMRTLANLGCFGTFVGMVTDSRSFLSYPRHEYFRRILCGLLGDFVEQGLYPADLPTLEKIVRDISFDNARRYFGLE